MANVVSLGADDVTALEASAHHPAPAGPEPALRIRGVRKMYRRSDGEMVPAVDDTTLDVAEGEVLVLLGASGCGKSTFLRCIAGLEKPDAGVIESHGKILSSAEDGVFIPPEQRDVSMIFQSYALWPHMTIFKNVAYPLTTGHHKGLSRSQVRERVMGVLEMVGIAHLAEQYPAQISGGQQQRVALARALVKDSGIVLFDEPLSNVDARVRDQLRAEIREMQKRLGFTAIYVTHDQEEAIGMADRIAVIDHGVVAHVAAPREVYLRPANLRVARFIGKLNEVEGTVTGIEEGRITVATALGEIEASTGQDGLRTGQEVAAVWRPDRTVLGSAGDGVNSWPGRVRTSEFYGSFTDSRIVLGDHEVMHWTTGDVPLETGGSVRLSVAPSDVRVLAR
ncbi:ABC transporter ATP-binding protein [Streptomyces sp. NTH33]|uniref:ABC transporter ATP-binding protein n=1 Tax=Streptomyces sp. NTH33 TaxID=1735453 RepID=UPI000DAA7B40|nr:ABC transporter ATP-binding protein [Streptomyces sp. NTH33]PZH16091.1 ABC transporter ATP-binding protein [Streptomyces sp. NTH33]